MLIALAYYFLCRKAKKAPKPRAVAPEHSAPAHYLEKRKTALKLLDEHAPAETEWEPAEPWDSDRPSFYFVPREVVLAHEAGGELARMQTLRDANKLVNKTIDLHDAFRGGNTAHQILFVSHRWEDTTRPDLKGEQLRCVQDYLKEHEGVQWVWYDYSCMPQKDHTPLDANGKAKETRSKSELYEFKHMLASINDLYLTCRVLILLDKSYSSRFWTLMEGWCAMQTATVDGVRPARDGEQRCSIACIHNATEKFDQAGLVDMISTKTPEEMHFLLGQPDIAVTSMKDKAIMLPIVETTDEHVRTVMAAAKVKAKADAAKAAAAAALKAVEEAAAEEAAFEK